MIFSYRDKESMVMKYAMGEKEVIVQRKGKEEAERKLKAMTKERDDMTARAKALAQEKAKAQQIADSRHQVGPRYLRDKIFLFPPLVSSPLN